MDLTIVTVVNRTSRALEGVFDSQQFYFPPNSEVSLLASAAEMCKRQNIQMGSRNPQDPREAVYLLGLREWGDDISPIEQRTDVIEGMDRSLLDEDAQHVEVRGGRRRRSRAEVALPVTEGGLNPVGIDTSGRGV